jgi:hypothetical protein
LLAGCATGGWERPPAEFTERSLGLRTARRATSLTTAHYEILTTVEDETLRSALPDFVEAAYARYQELVPATERPGRADAGVYFFARRNEWEAFTRRFTGPHAPNVPPDCATAAIRIAACR